MLLTAEQAFAERMAGGHDYSLGDIHVRATRSNPLSGAGAATTARNGPTFKPDVPASLPSGVGGYLLDSVEGYDTIGGPWLIFEPVDMGSLDTASGVYTPGVASPQRTYLGLSQRVPVQVLVEMATNMVSQRTIQVTYTNQDGVTGRQAASHTITVNALKNSLGLLVLGAGDTGVLEITNVTATGGTSPSGTIILTGILPDVLTPTTTVGVSTSCNLLSEGIVRRRRAGSKTRAAMLASQAAGRGIGQVNWICDPSTGPAPVGSLDPTASIADLMQADAKWGTWPEAANIRHTPGTAAAVATAGGVTMQTWDRGKAVPAYHSDVDGVVVTNYRASFLNTTESYLLFRGATLGAATIAAGSSTFVPGSAMPSRRYCGKPAAQQIPADMPTLRVTTALSGGTVATVVITYTNQDGTGGRTATLVLGTNPGVGSSYLITPHLQGTDTGILSVQNISVTGVNAGAVQVAGFKAIATDMHYTSSGAANVQLAMPKRHLILQTGDLLNVAKFGTNASTAGFATWDYSAVNK